MHARGYTMLELMLVIALISAVSGIAMIGGGQYMQSRWEDATRKEVKNLSLAVRTLYRDTGSFPAHLTNLVTNSPPVTGWHGPYVSSDVASVGGGYLTDAWGRAYQYTVLDATSFRIRSFGRNGVDNSGGGDDISADTDVTDIARAITGTEIAEINAAIRAYNVFNLPAAPLTGDYSAILATLVNQKYVNNADGHLDEDGFGDPYEAGPAPVQYVTSAHGCGGHQGDGEGDEEDDDDDDHHGGDDDDD